MPDTGSRDMVSRLDRTGGARRVRTELVLAWAGVVLLSACVGWLMLVAELVGGDEAAAVRMLAAMAAVFVAARWSTRFLPWLVPLLVTATGAYLALSHPDTLLGRPLGNPFGYSNAIGSFYMLVAAAALLLAVRAPNPAIAAAAAAAGVAAALVPFANSTTSASVLVCLLPLALLARSRRQVRVCVAAAGLAAALTLLVAVVIGAAYQPGERAGVVDQAVDATLSERRAELWRDALVMVAARPLTGIGPHRFPEESPTVRKDRDSRWPHNEALHFAAEAGIPALLLVLGIFGWALARLWWGAGDRGAAVAALALGAVGVHSNIDYVLHYPAVALAAAALVGAGSCLPRPRRRAGRTVRREAVRDPFADWDWSFLDQMPVGSTPPRSGGR